jgi:hypothetical protein
VSDTQLLRRKTRFDLTLDGLTFTRTDREAERRGVAPVHTVIWTDVIGARVESTGKGRTILRVDVVGASSVADHRLDPHAFKLSKTDVASAGAVVDRIEAEVAARRRWREHGSEVIEGATATWPEDASA